MSNLLLLQIIEGWFLDLPLAKIHHEDVAKWTAWAFFGLNTEDLTPEEARENDSYVVFLEEKCQWTFPPGGHTVVMLTTVSSDTH